MRPQAQCLARGLGYQQSEDNTSCVVRRLPETAKVQAANELGRFLHLRAESNQLAVGLELDAPCGPVLVLAIERLARELPSGVNKEVSACRT